MNEQTTISTQSLENWQELLSKALLRANEEKRVDDIIDIGTALKGIENKLKYAYAENNKKGDK